MKEQKIIQKREMTSEYRQAINDVMLIIENVEDGDLDYIVHKLTHHEPYIFHIFVFPYFDPSVR